MNRTELIEKLLLKFSYGMSFDYFKQILEEELPDFSRIDEERIFDLYRTLSFKDTIKEYNSTLPPALKPLPKEMPKEYNSLATPYQVWLQVQQEYGTPEPKPSLPTVEELAKEMLNVWNVNTFNEVAEYVINKYSLHAREWWQGDFKGLKVKTSIGAIKELDGKLYVRLDVGVFTTINNCTPYTPPTASEIIAKHNLSEEEIRAIREGK